MIVLSLPLGIISALRKDGLFDQITRVVLLVTLVMPAFWVGILFLTYFSVKLQLFPVAGYGDGWQEHLHHLFLPALTIALSIAPQFEVVSSGEYERDEGWMFDAALRRERFDHANGSPRPGVLTAVMRRR